MNKLEANLSLLAITFFASIQYVFLANVPPSVSNFAFMSVTNLVGFLIALAFFFGELYRLEKKQVLQSLILAGELFGFNLFLLLGSSGMDASVVSCVITAYFMFVPLVMLLLRQKVGKNHCFGVALVLVGVFFVMDADLGKFADIRILYLLFADALFALYIVTVERFCSKSNPSILAMGQMLFGFLFAFFAWCVEALLKEQSLTLPISLSFWSSVLFISLFIRGLYGVVQIYAQRYVSALNTSLIFSTEVVITLLVSPLLSRLIGTEPSLITPLKLIGCIVIVSGVLTADGTLTKMWKRRCKNETGGHGE